MFCFHWIFTPKDSSLILYTLLEKTEEVIIVIRKILTVYVLAVLTMGLLPSFSASTIHMISTHLDNLENNDTQPRIASDHLGNSYVSWTGYDGNDHEIYWVKIDSTGIPGTVQKISTHPDNTDRDDSHPRISADSLGNSYITWQGSDGNDHEIYWVKIDSTGIPGTVRKISTHPDNIDNDESYGSFIVADSPGNCYIAYWGWDGSDNEIYWLRINSSGIPSAVQKISIHPENIHHDDVGPNLGVDSAGNCYVTWWGYDGNDHEIYWVKIDSTGTLGTVQKISTHPDNMDRNDIFCPIAVDSSGNSYVTWWCEIGDNHEIYWVKIDSTGVPGPVQKISTHPDNEKNWDQYPLIALDPLGNSYITWNGWDGNDIEIYWVKIDSLGTSGAVQKISTHSDNINNNDYLPQIGVDSAGNCYITWWGYDGSNYQVYFVKIDSSGILGNTEKMSANSDNAASWDLWAQVLRIAVDPIGDSYVTWADWDGDDYEIYFLSEISDIVFGNMALLFGTNAFFVAGDQAYCTDTLAAAKIAHGLAMGGVVENPEGRTDLILTTKEHTSGNLILIGGPSINPVADEFNNHFGITFAHEAAISFEIFAADCSIFLDLDSYPQEDICIVYLEKHNGRNVMLVWGYGWYGTYAGSIFMGDPSNWQSYSDAHLLMLRWIDGNADGLIQASEISVEDFA